MCLAIAVIGVAALCQGAYDASQRVQHAYEPLPTDGELPAGAFFRARPSDGGALEYHEHGSDRPDARVWFFVHGSSSTGDVLRIFPGLADELKQRNVRVIAPTMPGWGASDPYGPALDISSAEWLERWAKDTLALLDHLEVEKATVSGLFAASVCYGVLLKKMCRYELGRCARSRNSRCARQGRPTCRCCTPDRDDVGS